MKNDQGLEAVRAIRVAISREFSNDPARLIAHYIEMQSQFGDRSLIAGPGQVSTPGATPSVARGAQLSVAADESSPRR